MSRPVTVRKNPAFPSDQGQSWGTYGNAEGSGEGLVKDCCGFDGDGLKEPGAGCLDDVQLTQFDVNILDIVVE